MTSNLKARIARLEERHDEPGPTGGISGVLVACARHRAARLASGISEEEYEAELAALPKAPWYVSICAEMDRHQDERQSWSQA